MMDSPKSDKFPGHVVQDDSSSFVEPQSRIPWNEQPCEPHMNNSSSSNHRLSSDLLEHYLKYGVENMETFLGHKTQDENDINSNLVGPRFIRLNPRYDSNETLKLFEAELPQGTSPREVSWLSPQLGFYSIPSSFSVHRSKCFESGRIYGMDVSSGAAVAALLMDEYDCNSRQVSTSPIHTPYRVIDLCCAPGLKLCAMADLLQSLNTNLNPITTNGERNVVDLVGVDICPRRISLCKNIVQKYQIHSDTPRGDLQNSAAENRVNIRLFCTDATKLGDRSISLNPSSLVFDSQIAFEQRIHAGKRKRMNKSARRRETKRLCDLFLLDKTSTLPLSCHPSELVNPTWLDTFDRVLVDAECSTDGALRHMVHKRERYSQPVYRNEKLTDPEKLQELVQLQKNLIMAGFQILRPGGRLVYSTCSLSSAQNEHVISWLLSQCPSAFLIPISFDLADKRMVDEGAIQGTVRFRPNITTLHGCSEDDLYGGGFFIAKLGKDIGK